MPRFSKLSKGQGCWTGAVAAAVAALVLVAVEARAEVTPGTPRLVTMNEVGTGELLLLTEEPGRYLPAPVVAADFDVSISGPVARTIVTQRFLNPSDGWIEGIYVFPLPEGSAVDTLRLRIGDRLIEGQIKERGAARAIYEAAKDEGKKASLVEQERPNIFTNSVANIGPHEMVVVQIEYQEALRLDGGAMSLRVPLVVAPRYSPPAELTVVDFGDGEEWGHVADSVPDRERIESPVLRPEAGPTNPVTIRVDLDAGFPLGAVTSGFHAINVTRQEDGRAAITLDAGAVAANRDFELVWRPLASARPTAALLRETVGGQDYLLALIVPPTGDEAPAPRPREAIFVLDTSGSMAGESIRQATASLLLALDRLRPGDRFDIIRFANDMTRLHAGPVEASPANVAAAKRWVAAMDAGGGTNMLPALQAALADPTPDDASRVRQVVFLTDGAIGNEARLLAEIDQALGRSRLFTVGIGSAPNGYFMSSAARVGRGTYVYVGSESEVAERMAQLFGKLESPVMTDLAASWPGDGARESFPDPMPDLYASEAIILTVRQEGAAAGSLVLTGRRGEVPWSVALDLADARRGRGIAKLWARSKIAALEDSRITGASVETVDRAVLDTALAHHLVSRLTSLVAVDVTPSRPADAGLSSEEVPLNLPEGWDYDKVFGEQKPGDRAALPAVPDTALAKLQAAPAPGSIEYLSAASTTTVTLPATATQAPMEALVGGILVFAGTTLLVLLRRRTARRA